MLLVEQYKLFVLGECRDRDTSDNIETKSKSHVGTMEKKDAYTT